MSSTTSPVTAQAQAAAAAQAQLKDAAASLIATAIGTPLDTTSVIAALVNEKTAGTQAEINAKDSTDTVQIQGLASLSAAMSGLQSALQPFLDGDALTPLTATASASGITAALGTGATANTYQITTSQIATSQTITSGTFDSQDANAMGAGTLTVSLGNASFTVNVSPTDDTLSDIAADINSASGNPGVKAVIVNGTNGGQSLSLESTLPGVGNTISVAVNAQAGGPITNLQVTSTPGTDTTSSGAPNTSGTPPGSLSTITSSSGQWMQAQAAGDAILTINGTVVTSSSNTIKNAVSGLTLTLTSAATQTGNQSQTLTVAPDESSVESDLSAFVTAYNAVIDQMNSLAAPLVNNVSGSGGALLGDEMINQLGDMLGSIVGGDVSSGGLSSTLASLGITFPDSVSANQPFAPLQMGDTVSGASLDAALTADPDLVSTLFNNTNGIADQLNSLVNTYTSSNGVITKRNNSLTDDIQDLIKQQDDLKDFTDSLKSSYQDQFTSLNTLMSTATENSDYLDQLFGSGNNPGALSQSG